MGGETEGAGGSEWRQSLRQALVRVWGEQDFASFPPSVRTGRGGRWRHVDVLIGGLRALWLQRLASAPLWGVVAVEGWERGAVGARSIG